MWHRFTDGARRVIFYAQEEAAALGTHLVGTEHLLLAMLRRDGDVVPGLLRSMDVPWEAVRSELLLHVSRGTSQQQFDMALTPSAKRAIDVAHECSSNLQSNYIGSEHLFLGVVLVEDGLAARVLARFGVSADRVRDLLVETRNARTRDVPESEQLSSTHETDPERLPPHPARIISQTEFGARAWRVIEAAIGYARSLDAGRVEVEHLKMAMMGNVRTDGICDPETGLSGDQVDRWRLFTERARRVVFFAQEEAARVGENYLGTEHLLLGLVRESDSTAGRILLRLGADMGRISAEVKEQANRGHGSLGQGFKLTPRAERVINMATEEVRQLNNNYIGTEHLLLGLIRDGDSLAARVLAKLGVDLERARRAASEMQDGNSQK